MCLHIVCIQIRPWVLCQESPNACGYIHICTIRQKDLSMTEIPQSISVRSDCDTPWELLSEKRDSGEASFADQLIIRWSIDLRVRSNHEHFYACRILRHHLTDCETKHIRLSIDCCNYEMNMEKNSSLMTFWESVRNDAPRYIGSMCGWFYHDVLRNVIIFNGVFF